MYLPQIVSAPLPLGCGAGGASDQGLPLPTLHRVSKTWDFPSPRSSSVSEVTDVLSSSPVQCLLGLKLYLRILINRCLTPLLRGMVSFPDQLG